MNSAIVLSGGVGLRLGTSVPKQYLRGDELMIVTYTVLGLLEYPVIDALVIVAAPEWEREILADMEKAGGKTKKFLGFATPGENRQESILHGLQKLKELADVPEGSTVLVQDAARPCTSPELLNRIYAGYAGHEGVMPVLPMKDTVYYSEHGDRVDKLLKRQCVYAGQAPELYDFEKYLVANEGLPREELLQINGSTEVAVLCGMDIAMVPGEEGNFKITTAMDLERYLGMLDH